MSDRARLTVLVVEDDAESRQMIVESLEQAGFSAAQAPNAADALARLEGQAPLRPPPEYPEREADRHGTSRGDVSLHPRGDGSVPQCRHAGVRRHCSLAVAINCFVERAASARPVRILQRRNVVLAQLPPLQMAVEVVARVPRDAFPLLVVARKVLVERVYGDTAAASE